MIARFGLLVQIALRNLRASPINLIIGGLIMVGTLFFVVCGALLSSLNQSMAKSVIGSVAGHIQVYSSASKDELTLFGGMGGDPELSVVSDFPTLKRELETIENVKTVVPMGVSGAMITSGNIVDVTLERVRALVRAREGQSTDPALNALPREELEKRMNAEVAHVRQIIRVLEGDAKKAQAILAEGALDKDALATLAVASTDEFWAKFDSKPYDALEFLENRVAPQVTDAQLLFLRYIGTDLDSFQQSFDRMQVVDGAPVPKGQRGFLISKFVYEDQLKLKNARRFDKIHDAIALGRTIAADEELTRFVRENRSQTRDIVLQLDALKTIEVATKLQGFLGSSEPDLATLLSTFFDTTDATFNARYDWFYKELAPMLQLYRVRIGDTLTIKAFTRGGIQSVNVRVYGTFAFKGLEKSPLAGATSLMDIMSFRDLYGYLTSDKKEELADLQRETGAKAVTRESAEADLFGSADSTDVVAEATAGIIDADKQLGGMGRKLRNEDLIKRVYSQKEIESGVVLNAAVMVKDPTRLDETIKRINELGEAKKLGIKAISWQQASGILGQIVGFFSVLLVMALIVIFGTAIVIINNAMMMATLQRTQMFGTLRAIGAQKSMVMSMVLIESILLGLLFGGAGMGLGAAVLARLHSKGIAAPNDVAYFFFSGPRLQPDLSVANLVLALGLILAVTIVSTLIPAVLATRVSPLQAMQSDE